MLKEMSKEAVTTIERSWSLTFKIVREGCKKLAFTFQALVGTISLVGSFVTRLLSKFTKKLAVDSFSTAGADLNKNNIYYTFHDCPLDFFGSLHQKS